MENNLPKRKQIRLKGFDYSQNGYYFVTICTEDKRNVFGIIQDNEMTLNDVGMMVGNRWSELEGRFTGIKLWEHIIMPNHIHVIVEIVGAPLVGARNTRAVTRPAPTIGDIIGVFKSITTHEYISGVKKGLYPSFKKSFWQRNYGVYPERSRRKHIIRSDNELQEVRRYIADNPNNWKKDKLYYP